MAKAPGKNHSAGDELRLLIERVQRLQEEIKELQADVKDVFGEAKSRGFDVKTMKNVIKVLKMEPHTRRETFGLMEVYLAALGESDGSLSDMAREFLEEGRRRSLPPGEEPEEEEESSAGPKRVPGVDPEAEPGKPAPPPITLEEAKRMGAEASARGVPVTSNPFPARDPRRAAWDEEWCKAAGTDGMEIPEWLRPADKSKGDKAKGEAKK